MSSYAILLQDEQDIYILSKVSDIIHSLFGTYKEAVLPVFDQLLPHFAKLLVSTQLPQSIRELIVELLLLCQFEVNSVLITSSSAIVWLFEVYM